VVEFLFIARDKISWTRPTQFRPYLVFAIPLAVVTIAATAAGTIDKIMIGYYDSNEAVAYYASSQLFLGVIGMVGVSVATLTYPSFLQVAHR
jgi:O-antigen/teichoic acid export membrane protein